MIKNSIKRCPVCKSANIGLYMGDIFGKYHCKKCGYIGAIIIEEDSKKD